jgi:PAS domain S-box-containing protein
MMSISFSKNQVEAKGPMAVLVIVAILVAGSEFVWLMAHRADKQMRSTLLVQAQRVKQSVNTQALKMLSGSSNDLEKTEYQQIKGQLIHARENNSKSRFIYLLGHKTAEGGAADKTDDFFIYADSENLGSAAYSPPGDVYEEISDDMAQVFKTRVATVTGPNRDRWGIWVSALVPITDPATGELIALLGMDIDARTWNRDLLARTVLPISLLLALLIILVAKIIATRLRDGRSTRIKPIQNRLLVPLAAMLLLLIAGAGALLIEQQNDSLDRLSRKMLNEVANTLEASSQAQSQTLDALGKLLLENADLRAALKAGDRNRLLADYGQVFARLKADYGLSLGYFIDTNRVCLLRLHLPEKYGDRIDRFTLREAERTGKTAFGFDLGLQGMFTLRSIQPIYDDRKLLGYLELGKEMESVLDALYSKDGIGFATIIRKTVLERANWEEGMRKLGRKADWTRFPDSVLSYSTLPALPAEVQQYIEKWLPTRNHAIMEASFANRSWHIMSFPLKDASASEVGHMLVLFDVTETKAEQARLRVIGFGGGLVFFVGLLGFLYVLLRHTDNSIRRQQSQLQKSEQRLNATLHSIGDGVITTDASGRVTDLNNVAEQLTGWTTAEALGHPIDEVFRIVHAMTRATAENPVEKSLREGVIVALANHTVLIARNGVEHQIADSCAPIRETDDGIMGVVLVFRDVSEEYQRRAALRASEARHRAMFEENRSIQLMIEAESGELIDANPAACSFYGYSREQMRQMKIHEINMFSQEELLQLLELTRSKQRNLFFFRHRLANGEIRDVESYASSLIVNGKECIYSIVHDITARKRAERELLESEKRLRAITDSAQDAIVMIDAEEHVSFWNPAAERIFGYAQDEVIGRDLNLLLAPPRYREAYRAQFEAIRDAGKETADDAPIELQAIRKTGEEVSVELSLSAIRLEASWHAVFIVRDVTDRKRHQEALLETNRQLREATARANELACQAQMASVAKSDFLANMSHEIRTPMNGVIGMTGLILDTELTDEQRRYAETVRTSAESLLGLINDILDFSKIEAGKMTLEVLDFDLQELVEDLASTMALRAQDKGLELLYSVATEVPLLLRGDPGRLRQILTNLVSNAVKFTQTGEVAIRVMLESEDTDSVLLRFSVRDTGIGIPKEKIGILFDKFTQADASTTRKYGGTGLGLAICKQLTELMGGEVSVISDEGKGSEFSFTARLAKQKEGAKTDLPAFADLHTVRVLIVDDNTTSREILVTYMCTWGMRPAETADGPSAIKMLLQAVGVGDPFQIAVLDMQMPVMDGEMLGRAIKADARLAGTRLVMLTSLGTRENASHFAETGFSACLTKPARHQELKRALSLALSSGQGKTSPQSQILVKHQPPLDVSSLFKGNKARILLAEDNITNQQVALGILKKLGLRADAVANGEEALKALGTLPYDLVLMDVQMPVMDGLEATRRIRDPLSDVRNHAVTVIAMTARAMQGDQEKCLSAGMNDYVSKPVMPQTLARVLEKWLKKQEGAQKNTNGNPGGTTRPSEQLVPKLPVLDFAGLMERVMNDPDLAKAILEKFPNDISQRIRALKEFLKTSDRAGAEREAHSIKGASASIGGEALRAEASVIEKAAEAGDLVTADMRMPELVLRFNQLKDAIMARLTDWRN